MNRPSGDLDGDVAPSIRPREEIAQQTGADVSSQAQTDRKDGATTPDPGGQLGQVSTDGADVRRRPARRSGDVFTVALVVVLLALVVVCFVGPEFTPAATQTNFVPLQAPSISHLFGTDDLGRDELTRVLEGGQVSIAVGVVVAVFCLIAGALFGGVAGYVGGIVDAVLMKISEFFQVIPPILLALVAAAFLGSNVVAVILILSLCMWPQVGRIVRVESARISTLGYVESAVAGGFSKTRVFVSDILPNALPPALVATTMTVGRAILWESGLSFLGLGDSNHPSWGALLSGAEDQLTTGAWWLSLFPGLGIFLIVLLTNLLGDRWNDVMNPMIARVKG